MGFDMMENVFLRMFYMYKYVFLFLFLFLYNLYCGQVRGNA